VDRNYVAVKRLSIVDRSTFDREANVLQNLRKKRHAHEHLVTLLATYAQGDYLHLILPWAEIDLDQYWRSRDPSPSSNDVELSTWVKRQCCGIAEAVSHIHRYNTLSGTSMVCDMTLPVPAAKAAQSQSHRSLDQRQPKPLFGRHGDIKPANILWFPDPNLAKGYGTLKLSDFGTTHFSVNENISKKDRYGIPNSRPYQSPECQLPGGELSSQCDVWALGCVFLEFVCWYFGGYKLLEEFHIERALGYESSSFFSIRREEISQSYSAELKESVIKVSPSLPDIVGQWLSTDW
jgi:serine/threonine protein kinase